MISFECDYNNGAHPKVLENLIKYNGARPTPYGFDEFSDRAKDRIHEACGMPDAQIFFLTGGTQTNATTIDSMLYQYEGVICVETGHINVHEAGAVEFTEHKIITLPGNNGKMDPKVLDKYLDDFMHDGNNAHAVFPGLVYITFPTELGTIYTAKELDEIYQVCQHYEIPLYIDGARLGYCWLRGMMSPSPTLPVIVMSSISVEQRLEPYAVRLSYSPTAKPTSISSPSRNSMGRLSPKVPSSDYSLRHYSPTISISTSPVMLLRWR